jgi:hypothetical protein
MSFKTIMFFVLIIASLKIALFANLRNQDTNQIDETFSKFDELSLNEDYQENLDTDEIEVENPNSNFIQVKDLDFIENIDSNSYSEDDKAEEESEDKLIEEESEVVDSDDETLTELEAVIEPFEEGTNGFLEEAEETDTEEALEKGPIEEIKQEDSLELVSNDLLSLLESKTSTDEETDAKAQVHAETEAKEENKTVIEEKSPIEDTSAAAESVVETAKTEVKPSTEALVEEVGVKADTKVEEKLDSKSSENLRLLEEKTEVDASN